MNKEKVGLVSVSIHNYGSLLQTYAMQKVLDKLEIDNEIILFKSDPVKQFYRVFNIPFLSMKLKLYKRKIVSKIKYPEIYKGSCERDRAFQQFKDKKCRFTPKITSRDKLNDMGEQYRAVVLGSDQVWNPANLEMNFYTLNFVPKSKTKVAYAPSFGVSAVPKKQREKTREYLNRIQYISVREKAGAEIVKDLTGRDVPVVCDPTALLTREDWNELRSDKKYTDQKYIFCYFLGSNPEHRRFAEKVKALTGYQIIALQHLDEFVKGDLKFGDITPYDVGPQDFINLLSRAEIVLTDSFHGTMFSIYYHKKFIVFPRYQENEKNSTNSRISSILQIMNLSDRKIKANASAEDYLEKKIDWDNVQSALENFRNQSMQWFVDSLKDGKVI